MTNEKAIMCLEDMKIKVPIPKAAKQARENNEALDVAIKTLKSEPHWIPVTERLPEESGLYQVTDRWGNVVRYVFNTNGGSVDYWKRCVKAWMPLPEPYKRVTE